MTTFYHYTCLHGWAGIRASGGILKPGTDGVVWLTDLSYPFRLQLGLTSTMLSCDRTAYRYRVTGEPATIQRWVDVRRTWDRDWVAALESAPGAMPMHWYVSGSPIEAVYSPVVFDGDLSEMEADCGGRP